MRNFLRNNRGVALIEFAFVAPILILLILGAVELARYILIIQKVEKAGYVLTDIVAQFPRATTNPAQPGEISDAQLDNVYAQFSRIMRPYDNAARQVIIFTSVSRVTSGANTETRLQWVDAGGGTLTQNVNSVANNRTPSQVAGPAAGLRNTLVTFNNADVTTQMNAMPTGENIIIGEIFYRYEPFLRDILLELGIDIAPATVNRRMYFKPRAAPLVNLPPNYGPP